MYFDFHLTKRQERIALMEQNDFETIEIDPEDIIKKKGKEYFERGKSTVWDEDYNDFYEIDYSPIIEALEQFDKNPAIKPEETAYYKAYIERKGKKYFQERIPSLFETYKSIKEVGIKEPIVLEKTGERIDGSFRSSIAIHLGIKKIPARLHSFKWWDIDRDFVERKIQGHYFGLGRDYYYIEYSPTLRNFPYQDRGIYYENSELRWKEILLPTLSPIVGKYFLDLGCNKGYISCMLANEGGFVKGIDYISQATSNLNKLIFEKVYQKDFTLEFEEADVRNYKIDRNYDWILLLNTLYHIPRKDQLPLLKRAREKTKRIILQCNLRKEKEREKYFTSHPDDAISLLKEAGFKNIKRINWRFKPIIIAE